MDHDTLHGSGGEPWHATGPFRVRIHWLEHYYLVDLIHTIAPAANIPHESRGRFQVCFPSCLACSRFHVAIVVGHGYARAVRFCQRTRLCRTHDPRTTARYGRNFDLFEKKSQNTRENLWENVPKRPIISRVLFIRENALFNKHYMQWFWVHEWIRTSTPDTVSWYDGSGFVCNT